MKKPHLEVTQNNKSGLRYKPCKQSCLRDALTAIHRCDYGAAGLDLRHRSGAERAYVSSVNGTAI